MKYVLIKEYPYSPKLGTILDVYEGEPTSLSKYSEFWAKYELTPQIYPLLYEVKIFNDKFTYFKNDEIDDSYINQKGDVLSLEDILRFANNFKIMNVEILSVKLNETEILKLGDNVVSIYPLHRKTTFPLKQIIMGKNNNEFCVIAPEGYPILIQHLKKYEIENRIFIVFETNNEMFYQEFNETESIDINKIAKHLDAKRTHIFNNIEDTLLFMKNSKKTLSLNNVKEAYGYAELNFHDMFKDDIEKLGKFKKLFFGHLTHY